MWRCYGVITTLMTSALMLQLGADAAKGGDCDQIPSVLQSTVDPYTALGGAVIVPGSFPANHLYVVVRDAVGDRICWPIIDAREVLKIYIYECFDDDQYYQQGSESGEWDTYVVGGGCSGSNNGNWMSYIMAESAAVNVRIWEEDYTKSPDFSGVEPGGGDGTVDLSDLTDFAGECLAVDPPGCHDYDNNGLTNLVDLLIFSPAYASGTSCLQP